MNIKDDRLYADFRRQVIQHTPTVSPTDFQIHLDSLSLIVTYQGSYQRACQCHTIAAFHRSDPALTATSKALHLSRSLNIESA
ncbi:hypothetical protein TNCV_2269271 [Trichonephila clavipes]|nr:hypothetical protein TNCV_2269271 [Trichonephila clavipes]